MPSPNRAEVKSCVDGLSMNLINVKLNDNEYESNFECEFKFE